MSDTACVLCMDMGGTNLRFGLVDHSGELKWSLRTTTEAGLPREEIFKKMLEGLQQGIDVARSRDCAIEGIGAGVPGCVDFERGFVYTLTNVPGWDNTPLARMIEEKFGLAVFIDNDVNAMALGEHRFGSAQDANNVICVTLGTGVGGALILEGRLYRGSSFTAGEIGHVVIRDDGPPCNCGNRGCLERYIGNRYLVERAALLYRRHAGMHIPEDLTPETLAEAARHGDDIAGAVWKEAAGRLGLVLAGLVTVINPDRVIVGGGIANAGILLFEPLEKVVVERSMKIPGRHVKIVPAKLGEDAGLIGAAALAMENLL